jgi:Co/Zn/Cd efflux system component
MGVIFAGVLVAWTGSAYPDLIIGILVSLFVLNGARKIFGFEVRALLQITTNGKLKTVLAKGAAYESFPWSAFSGRNHSLGCALVL